MASISREEVVVTEISPEEYPVEVKRCIVELRKQRQRLFVELGKIDHERKKLQNDIRILTDRLAKISFEQAQKMQFKIDLEKTIDETESAYSKLIETSKGLYKTVNETKKSIQDPDQGSRTEMRSTGMGSVRGPISDNRTDGTATPPLVPLEATTSN
ncbi:uncharacterized protein LOC120347660 [Styela clava]|uniref:Sjoegren syndrome nuclear autoantigen 1 homolog n=1 Tax=Styela clava TaxID=7725 RepID=UPI00193A3E04|nr:Sjoegren syndrome nuclear autoantigen 1 homolog [Styela clava]